MRILSRFKLLGVIFLALIVGSVYLTYAIFSKKFVDYDRVTLETTTVGLNLPERADIKIRGVIVGTVLDQKLTDDGAELVLGIFPSQASTIPENVTASILPKTLFGEKYVSLDVPKDPSKEHIAAGDTITRTVLSTEVEEVLNDLYPLLDAVQPGDLNMTLNAISTALEGRGDQLGNNLETLDAYLKKFNPQLPALVEDLRLTSQVSDTYADVLPQVATILRNTIKTSGTLKSREDRLDALYTNVSAFSETTRSFLVDNGDNLIELGRVSRPQLDLLARYSPEFPCLLRGVVNADKRQAQAFRNYTLHIVLETLPRQPRAYTAADKPRNGETRGPQCLSLPNPPFSQANPSTVQPNLDDGVDSPTGKGTERVAPSYYRNSMAYAGSDAETGILKSLLAPALGTSADQVSDLGPLLLGPMMRGTKVSLR